MNGFRDFSKIELQQSPRKITTSFQMIIFISIVHLTFLNYEWKLNKIYKKSDIVNILHSTDNEWKNQRDLTRVYKNLTSFIWSQRTEKYANSSIDSCSKNHKIWKSRINNLKMKMGNLKIEWTENEDNEPFWNFHVNNKCFQMHWCELDVEKPSILLGEVFEFQEIIFPNCSGKNIHQFH